MAPSAKIFPFRWLEQMKGVSEMALPYYVPQFWVKAKPKLQLRPHQHVSRLFLKTDGFFFVFEKTRVHT